MFPVLSANTPSGAYTLSNSLRFRASATAYLSRTPASAGSQTTWTWSGWVKRGILGSQQKILTAGSTGSLFASFEFIAGDNFQFYAYNGATNAYLVTTQVFRDPSAWYHIIFVCDTTQATSSNRLKLYVNGVQITSFSTATYPTQNFTFPINNNVIHNIGRDNIGASYYFDGYLTETNFVDGQALTPSSFGSTNATTGVWQPARYTGSYGTNGFYLNFNSIALTSGSNTGLGKDNSGNGNYWNTNNISVTAGITYDAMIDVPTLTSTTVSNYCVWNPTISFDGTNLNTIMSNGNLTATDANSASYNSGTSATIGVNSGKWYWENTIGSGTPLRNCNGISFLSNSSPIGYGVSYDPYISSGAIRSYVNSTPTAIQTGVGTIAAGDIVAIALDADAQTIKWYKNNVQVGTTLTYTSYLPTGYSFVYPGFWTPNQSGASISTTFGQRPFTYTPPTGFVALNTYNLPDSTIVQGNKYMDATLYTGNLTGQSITNAAAFKPDLVWIKSRSAATDNKLTDSNRGTTKALVSNSTAAETTDLTGMTAFNTNGFTLGASTTYNNTGATYVGWQWQAGQGTNTSNTSGTITSTVSVNTSAGFSVVTYTGNGTAGATVGHGLGVAPKMVIIKNRTEVAGTDWQVWFTGFGTSGTVSRLSLNTSAAVSTTTTNYFYPNSTNIVMNSGDHFFNSASYTYVAYCWAEITGFSKMGSYTGNGSADGPFVYCGFQPAYVIIKNTTSGTGYDWEVYDNKRLGYNLTNSVLYPDLSNAEATTAGIDILSNGFKLRVAGSNNNPNGATMIFMAFASNPFKNALAR